MLGLGPLFGWRKASKCKKLVNLLRCRLKLLKSKRYVIVRQLREDIAQLLNNGQYERAFSLAEQLFRDQSLLDAYDLLGNYCEFIIIRFRYIRRYKDCPEDIIEAISTLIFATAWCGDLPELPVIRKLFGERFGNKFTKASAELHSGNFVNPEIRKKLYIESVPDDVKLKLIIQGAKEYVFMPGQLGCDSTSKVHLLQCGKINDRHLEGFIFKEEACVSYNKHSQSVLSFVSVPAKHIQAQCKKKPTVMPRKTSSPSSSLESCGSSKLSTASSEETEDPGRTKNVYLEEVKELEFSVLQDQYSEDKRIFLFNSCIHPLRTKQVSDCPESCREADKVANAASSSIIVHQDQRSEGSATSSCSHVHPKLPDYDELAVKFKALKEQHLQRKNRYKRQVLYFLGNDRFC
ncbi:uncharacterized protein LOC112534830 [Ricinus communis]|uniref:Vacuolar protein sorting-associated protein Ist1 n=1 Tax=Ricinus communis TaxID=3988 RepID=B9RZ48_RICCO|nr:uncharacterized protein LOC112534830 [Ricinus communis]EEF43228.1 conserved hypothetical protein [Ricinus communis]